jgi:hypothetical protein
MSTNGDMMRFGNQPSQQGVSELSSTVDNAENHAKAERQPQKFTNRLSAAQGRADSGERPASEKGELCLEPCFSR